MTLSPADRTRLKWGGAALAIILFLKITGDVYPFSNFPMYSNFGDSADVLRVETPDGTMLPLDTVFGKKESRTKKMWKSKLGEICGERGHDSENATDDEKRLAGEYLLGKLVEERRRGRLEEFGVSEIILVQTRITLKEDGELVESAEPIARLALEL